MLRIRILQAPRVVLVREANGGRRSACARARESAVGRSSLCGAARDSRSRHGCPLVLPAWLGCNTQFAPMQLATSTRKHTTWYMQHTAWYMQHTTWYIQTCDPRHANRDIVAVLLAGLLLLPSGLFNFGDRRRRRLRFMPMHGAPSHRPDSRDRRPLPRMRHHASRCQAMRISVLVWAAPTARPSSSGGSLSPTP